ncbi:ABC transporter ATP-binding protein [Thermogladius sp.]|uniref:ABC transporter ATP-binding protein n=1 Tax=Thermogladius sp. TaxID=2023064 RepID=UPI003D14D333
MLETPDQGECFIKLEGVVAGYRVTRSLLSIRRSFTPVLKDVNLCLRPGERVAVIGESGSGKTTLLKVVLGLLRPVKGRVVVDGRDIYRDRASWLRSVRKLGYVPQDPYRSLDPRIKIRTSLVEPLERTGMRREEVEERVRSVLKLVGLHEEVLDLYPRSLSGGMLQRVLIARAIVGEPKYLLLDEPTSSLDVSTQAQIVNLINDIYEKYKIGVLLVTHDLAVAQYLADRVVILREGRVVEEGLFEEVILRPRHEYTRLLVKSYMMEPI